MRRTRLNVLPPVSKQEMRKSEMSAHMLPEGRMPEGRAETNGYALVSVNGQTVPSVTVTGSILEANMAKESRTQRVRRLQEEAKQLAREQIKEFEAALLETARMADEIAEGGDIYPIGVREICRRMAEELPRNHQTLQAIIKKI
jgi:hypothetical protein